MGILTRGQVFGCLVVLVEGGGRLLIAMLSKKLDKGSDGCKVVPGILILGRVEI